ncbi:ROK family protein [Breznakiella homolactica]|uniref:ROK family protein n=1 Tax=Breznakiella homolactica TaxID=2798577 RepID=A0A7T7XK78_9SPIR|nr:ROK family protein [Breznakiella homolactica]QQO07935.1 ROK family protein [Breznakiella homolactica]
MKASGTVTLAVDAGGTYYKAALVDADGTILPESFRELPSRSEGDRETILSALRAMLAEMMGIAAAGPVRIGKVAFAFPGPFDHGKGACIMKHKFTAVYGEPLKPHIDAVLGAPAVPVSFHHDLHACTYGAYLYDAAQGFSSVFCVAVGTGLGTGYLRDGTIVMMPHGGPMYPIFQRPYKDGILEDIVSNRGIAGEYRRLTGTAELPDAKAIEILATEHGDEAAREVYRNMGQVLGSVIAPLLDELEVDCLVLGGQISKGYPLFGPALEKELSGKGALRFIGPLRDFTYVAIRGLAALPVPERYGER